MLSHHYRFDYSPVTNRSPFEWPGGKRLAVYVALNLDFSFGDGLGAKLADAGEPDILNFARREYDNRVGAWRMLDLFDQLKLPVTALVNTALYEHCPQLIAAYNQRGDEIVAQMLEHAESLVMGIALHSYITGQPFRLPQLRRALNHINEQRERVWLCTAGDIASHFKAVGQWQ